MDYENYEQYEQNGSETENTPLQSPYANSPYETSWQQQYVAPKKKKKKKGMSAGKVVVLSLCCVLLGIVLCAGGLIWSGFIKIDLPSSKPVDPPSEGTQIQVGDREDTVIHEVPVHTGEMMTPAQVYAANVNSTVGVTTMTTTTNYWGYQTQTPASGSGFILTADGYVLTNYHVIKNSTSVTVTDYSGKKYRADVVGYDESNDVAVLKIEANDLQPVILGSSSNMNVGDQVLAIGNPLGELTFSLTGGLISAMEREVTMDSGIVMDLIQTDCAINSGNSGGPLFNLYGEVIGITNAKYSSGSSGVSIDNISFAIPINSVKPIVESIIQNGYVSKPYIGISVTDVSEDARDLGLPQGAAVKEIVPNGPAAQGGLRVYDIITHLEGEAVTGSSDLVKKVGQLTPGTEARFTVYRQGEVLELTIAVSEQRTTASVQEPEQEEPQQGGQYWFPWSFGY